MIIGVLGGGQLARMLALAGHPLGIRVIFLDPADDACAGDVALQLKGEYTDEQQLLKLAEMSDVVTYEFENVPADSAAILTSHVSVYPPQDALSVAQDRLAEKTLFRQLDIPPPDFHAVDSVADLHEAVKEIGLPAILKTRREGYDGKGQVVLKPETDLAEAWETIEKNPGIVEAMVAFDREISVVAVRDQQGQTVVYPVSENVHRDGILYQASCCVDDPMQSKASDYIIRLLDHFNYVGVLALELFQVDDQLLVNEFAPRVHNSGHWTIEGSQTSQFENHLRAIAGLPLGDASAVDYTTMINCIGEMPEITAVLDIQGAHLHDYGKSSRSGRKVGHVTLRAENAASLKDNENRLASQIEPS